MAFGLRFNKAKTLEAAMKFVDKGKFPAAIAEYRKILAKDPKDLTILNTVGDLYVRLDNKDEAVKCFYELAENFLEKGFALRGIAVYKRITKMDSESIQAILKLGELYASQGLMRDSRSHYLQAVDYFLRRNDKEKARDEFEKILLLDMENPKLQFRMAELYAETGKREEAIATYLGAGERFLDGNQPAEAAAALEALFRLDPENADGKAVLGRAYMEQGDLQKAVETLQAIPQLENLKAPLNLLFHAYRKLGDADKGREIAQKLFDLHEDFAGLAMVAEEKVEQGECDQALEVYQGAAQKLSDQQDVSGLIGGLQKILAAVPAHPGALRLQCDIYEKTGRRGELRESLELLANSHVEREDLEKAREVCVKLLGLEPENRGSQRLLQQVEAKLHGSPIADAAPAASEPTAAMAAELQDVTEPGAEGAERLSPRDQEILQTCLTESEIYITYHQNSKAIEILEACLPKLPGNLKLNEQLLTLYEQLQQYQKAADCSEVLAGVYGKAGDGERASRYGELTASYRAKAPESPAPAVEAEAEQAAVSETAAPEEAASEASQVREVDLSVEWTSLSSAEAPPAESTQQDGVVEEAEFYLQAGLVDEAKAALECLREQAPSHPAIESLEEKIAAIGGETAGVETAEAEASPVPEQAAAEPLSAIETSPAMEVSEEPAEAPAEVPVEGNVETPVEESVTATPEPLMEAALPEAETPEPEAELVPAAAGEETEQPVAGDGHPELMLEEVLASQEHDPHAPAFELSLEEAPAQEKGGAGHLQDPLAGLAGELGEGFVPPTAPSGAGQPRENLLGDILAEFKDEVEEPATGGDLETHYNMGVAFKEMALYEEAIGEFQKVHQLAEQLKDTSYLLQCCSLLAVCFLEKGLPELAVKWYQTALDAPSLDAGNRLGLLYEMAAAYEVAGDRESALKRFKEVYALNIDYRDVTDRISALQQAQ